MYGTISISPYIWRVADMPAEQAADGLDRCLADAALRDPRARDGSSIDLGWARVRFDGGALRLEPIAGTRGWPLRRLTGTLRSRRGWYRMRVELELYAGSESRTEIGLRPLRRWPPRVLSPAPYFRYGVAVLELLVAEMEQWGAVRAGLEGLPALREAS